MAIQSREPASDELTDGQLVQRAIGGDKDAYDVLYRRHTDAAHRVAAAVTGNSHDAADAVSEAFTRLMTAMTNGRVDPEVPFRPYLLVTTRNVALDMLRRGRRVEPTEVVDLTDSGTGRGPSEHLIQGVDAAFVTAAFRSLPERWRSVLWLTEVEGLPPREVGDRMGLSANAASQLAIRARNGLRERYLQAHLGDVRDDGCRDAIPQLGAYAAGALSPRGVARVDQHLAGCESCQARVAELEAVDSELRRVLVPIPLFLVPTAIRGATAATHSLLTGGEGMARLTRRLFRPLAGLNAGLLALGMITAAVLGDGSVPGAVAGARPQALAPASAPNIQLFEPASTAIPAAPVGAAGPIATITVTPSPTAPAGPSAPVTVVVAAPAPPGGTRSPGPSGPPPPSSGVVQVSVGANAGVTTVSVSVGIGGGCTAVSVAGATSCAAPAPKAPGIVVKAATPVGSVS